MDRHKNLLCNKIKRVREGKRMERDKEKEVEKDGAINLAVAVALMKKQSRRLSICT